MELLPLISGDWATTPLLMSSWLMVMVLGALGYGMSRRFPPGAVQPAMVRAWSGAATRRDHPGWSGTTIWPTGRLLPAGLAFPPGLVLHAGRAHMAPSGEVEYAIDRSWSPGARLGVWFQPPRRVVTGRRAHLRWWHRIRSIVLLTAFIVIGGVATATAIGIGMFLSGFLVEQAIG
ncbi:MAG: hypothetical protein ACJA0A_000413 [Acidimicrobiales bacterium]|jgi:hypothetical protein